MELVPIIVQVLKIVTILAIATFLISYITFRIKQKKNPLNPSIEPAPVILRSKFLTKSLQRITKIREPKPVAKPIPPKEEKKIQKAPEAIINRNFEQTERKIEKKSEPKLERESPKEIIKPVRPKQEVKREDLRRNEKPIEKRLEVVKNLSLQNNALKPTPKDKRPQVENLNSIGNDVFDNYHDKDDKEMFPLKVDKNIKDK